MHLFFIRHGQSENNALYARGEESDRVEDPLLTEIGQRQAALLAETLATGHPGPHSALLAARGAGAGFRLTHIYASLMQRAAHTGSILADRLGLPLRAWPDWHETGGIVLNDDGGVLQGRPGMNRAFYEQHYPGLALPDDLGAAGWWNNRPLETAPERAERARRVLADLLARHGGTEDRVAVVSHGGFYNFFLAALLGLEANPPVWHLMNNCALSCFHFGPREPVVVYQNRAEYLGEEWVTE